MTRLPLILALLAGPAMAEDLILPGAGETANGPAAKLAEAHRLYTAALMDADTALLVQSIRLAREVTVRPAQGWQKDTAGKALSDQQVGRAAPRDPAGPEALAIAQAFAGEDATLLDLVYDLDAQLPRASANNVSSATSDLAAGQTDRWRIAFYGSSPAEVAVLGDGDSDLTLTVSVAPGTHICETTTTSDVALCQFTQERNEFFLVEVTNFGTFVNTYHLISN